MLNKRKLSGFYPILLLVNIMLVCAIHAKEFVIEGRHEIDDQGRVVMGFGGVTTHISFEGTAIELVYEVTTNKQFLDVRIDGGPYEWIALDVGEQKIEINAETDGPHRVEIVRRNENWQGLLKLVSVNAKSNTVLMDAPELPQNKLMFIGDSITAGDSSDVRSDAPKHANFEHSGRMAYGYQLSRLLDAQVHLVSYGGKGIIRDWQGNEAEIRAPVFYERSVADYEASKWDHSKYVPDVVGICLGTNDFSRGIPDQNEFVNAYVELVRKVLRDAPSAKVVLIDSPMFGVQGEGAVRRSVLNFYLETIVQKLNDKRVQAVSIKHYPGRPENAHPLANEHTEMALELKPIFEGLLK